MRIINSLVDRSLDIVEMLAEDARSVRLGEISDQLGLPKSATHRLLNTLVGIGWVAQDEDTGFYRLTLRLAIVGQRFLIATRIPDVCQPLLDGLARDTQELVRLAIVEGEGLTWVAFSQGAHAGLVYEPEMVAKVTLHATASGKVWLSALPVDTAVRIALRDGFGTADQFGPNCIRSVEALIKELEVTRKRGWGLALEEATPGIAAAAAAIRPGGAKSRPVGTVSVAGPVLRLPQERLERIARQVGAAAEQLGRLWPLSAFQPQSDQPLVRRRAAI